MQPTLALLRAPPPARAHILTDTHCSRTGRAAYGRKTRSSERMRRELVLGLIAHQVRRTPVSQRIKFPLRLIGVPLEAINSGSLMTVKPLLTRYPPRKRCERTLQHRHLSECATRVGVDSVELTGGI